MKFNNVNIGEIIRSKVEELGISKAQFAKSINLQRQNIEKTIFFKHSIDTDMLCRISEVLDCNLFDYYTCDNDKQIGSRSSEIKAKLIIELGNEVKDKTFTFSFGNNNIKIN